jgi:hypothetical protein
MNAKRPYKSNRPKESAKSLDDFDTTKWDQNTKFHLSAASAKTIRSITVTFLVSTLNSK